jgi:hypothetical protein
LANFVEPSETIPALTSARKMSWSSSDLGMDPNGASASPEAISLPSTSSERTDGSGEMIMT